MTNDKKGPVRLVIYPGERIGPEGYPVGTLYILNGAEERYDAVGGPPPGKGEKGPGGHSAGETPAGIYELAAAEHHVTSNWPKSVVPWGAPIREEKGVIQYQVNGRWIAATGPNGTVYRAYQRWELNSGNLNPNPKALEAKARNVFIDDVTGKIITKYDRNDFGLWSWNMTIKGKRTAIYIHTTPNSEWATSVGLKAFLPQSHGCVHIRPVDRDAMVAKGYLKRGVAVEVKKYGEVGPPPGFKEPSKK